jgi:ribosomal-protein-alanine N-acetyltransferase
MELPTISNSENVITIRPMLESDIDTFMSWMNNPEVQETFIRKSKVFEKDYFLKDIYNPIEPRPANITYSVIFEEEIVGRVRLQNIDWEAKNAWVSILISPEEKFRGKGLGTVSASLLTELARKLEIKTLYAKVHSDNVPSLKIFRKLNYREVGKLTNYTISKGILVDAFEFEKEL